MTPGTASSLMTNEVFAAVRAHPGFRDAVERAASESVAYFQRLDPAYQWITKDIGRASICVTALTLHLMGSLTAQTLTAACVEGKLSSAGRVQQVISGAIGLDAWEWGVTLFAADPLEFKKLVTEMRFDEVSAKYAEFGEFYVGRMGSVQEVLGREDGLMRWGNG